MSTALPQSHDLVPQISLNQQFPISEADQATVEEQSEEEEEESDQEESNEEESDEEMPRNSTPRGRKRKGMLNHKKLEVFDKKFQSLMKNLEPIPFKTPQMLELSAHENLLRKLDLWDFATTPFDINIRKDLIAQLVASYDSRVCFINTKRYALSRAELARTFKITLLKDKKNSDDLEEFSEGDISFLSGFVSQMMLLHEDMWLMPEEIINWLDVIKEGHPEKVDWAGMLWLMVEKELAKGESLCNCYYASHLQHWMKGQGVFEREVAEGGGHVDLIEVGNEGDEEDNTNDVEGEGGNDEVPSKVGDVNPEVDEKVSDAVEVLGEEMKVDDDAVEVQGEEMKVDDDAVEVQGEEMKVDDDAVLFQGEEMKISDAIEFEGEMENCEIGGPSVELTLGKDSEKEEGMKDVDVMNFENNEESDVEEENAQGQWLMNGNNDLGDHFLQPCSLENGRELVDTEDCKVEEDNEEFEDEDDDDMGNKFHVFPNDDLEGDGFTGNFLQTMEGNQISFGSHGHNHMQQMESGPAFLNESGKRVIEHENGIFNHSLGDNNKRLRINVPSEPKPVDFGTCMENVQQMMDRARMFYTEKEQALEQAGINQQVLLNELERRDEMISLLQKSRLEENQKHENEKYRYERELNLMENILKGYRKAMRDTQKAFEEYKQRAQLPEVPAYKHVGGGLMLSTGEIERMRKKQEEEHRVNCLIMVQRIKETEICFVDQMDACLDKVNMFDERLTGLEADAKELTGLFAKRKVLQTEEEIAQVVEPAVNDEIMLDVVECPASEDIVPEVAEINEMKLDVAEPPTNIDNEPHVAHLPSELEKEPDVAEYPADEEREPDVAADETKEVDVAADEVKKVDAAADEANKVDVAELPSEEKKDPEAAEPTANE